MAVTERAGRSLLVLVTLGMVVALVAMKVRCANRGGVLVVGFPLPVCVAAMPTR